MFPRFSIWALFGVIVFGDLGAAAVAAAPVPDGSADEVFLSDTPGAWFRSEATGGPVSIIDAGERVDFKIDNCCTSTRHTVTLVIKPVGSAVTMDQDSSQHGTLSVTFDVPGVYVFICKVHPYMTGVVAVRDNQGNIPPVTADSLPFLDHLGVDSLPAETVLSVMTTVAPTEADKLAKWDILGPEDQVIPPIPGVGEVWVNAQFERVPGQIDEVGGEKPGTIVVVDARTFTVEREINGLDADGKWNNPHNMWADFALDHVYNGNWFGKWINKIDRKSGDIIDGIEVGEAPTHIITIPNPNSAQFGFLTIPLSADNDLVKVIDTPFGLVEVDHETTGDGKTHPHGHWLTCGRGDRVIVPNVFKGVGFGGSISILDTESGDVLREFPFSASDPLRSALLMPIAAGECHVDGVSTAYVANLVSGMVTVINVDEREIITNIPVTLTPDDQTGFDLLHTLQGPIQTPVSPDEKWVATAVISLTTVDRASTGSADHVAIIDTHSNQVVAFVPTPAGTHGVNWGAKFGGGYYAYVTNQHANVLTVIDPDPNMDSNGTDAAAVGTILLANGSPGAGVTDGTGGQGIKPLPMTHDGWIQRTVELAEAGQVDEEVEGWIEMLTREQQDPGHHTDVPAETFTVNQGQQAGGELEDTAASDDVYLTFKPRSRGGRNLSGTSRLVEVEFTATAPEASPAELEFVLEAFSDAPGATSIEQSIELFNHTNGTFEEVDVRLATDQDSVVAVEVTGDPSRFIHPTTLKMRARVRWERLQQALASWTASIDRLTWSFGE
jgi:hypothetical protein